MDLRHAAAEIAFMVLVCVMAMFLHPVALGPYSAVHGPTTALRSRYKSFVIFISMMLAALTLAERLVSGLLPLSFLTIGAFLPGAVLGAHPDPLPLRC